MKLNNVEEIHLQSLRNKVKGGEERESFEKKSFKLVKIGKSSRKCKIPKFRAESHRNPLRKSMKNSKKRKQNVMKRCKTMNLHKNSAQRKQLTKIYLRN